MSGLLKPSEGMKKTLLWTNPKPTTAFAAQTLALDLSEYSYISVKIKTAATVSTYQEQIIPNIEGVATISTLYNGSYCYVRKVTLASGGITFGTSPSTSSTSAENTTRCVPTEIYGIKGKIR